MVKQMDFSYTDDCFRMIWVNAIFILMSFYFLEYLQSESSTAEPFISHLKSKTVIYSSIKCSGSRKKFAYSDCVAPHFGVWGAKHPSRLKNSKVAKNPNFNLGNRQWLYQCSINYSCRKYLSLEFSPTQKVKYFSIFHYHFCCQILTSLFRGIHVNSGW